MRFDYDNINQMIRQRCLEVLISTLASNPLRASECCHGEQGVSTRGGWSSGSAYFQLVIRRAIHRAWRRFFQGCCSFSSAHLQTFFCGVQSNAALLDCMKLKVASSGGQIMNVYMQVVIVELQNVVHFFILLFFMVCWICRRCSVG